MEFLSTAATTAVSLTLGLSGIAKLFESKTTGRIVESVGILPRRLGRLFGTLLPLLETALAAALLTDTLIVYAVWGCLLLFLSFIVANAKVMIEGRDIACNCFGRLFSGQLGKGALYHSLLLTALTLPWVWQPSFSPIQGIALEDTAGQLWLGAATLVLFGMGLLLRVFGKGLNGIAPGLTLPAARFQQMQGGEVELPVLLSSQPRTVLVFVSYGCKFCRELLPLLDQLHREHPLLRIQLVALGNRESVKQLITETESNMPIVCGDYNTITKRLNVKGFPFAMVIDQTGVVLGRQHLYKETMRDWLVSDSNGAVA